MKAHVFIDVISNYIMCYVLVYYKLFFFNVILVCCEFTNLSELNKNKHCKYRFIVSKISYLQSLKVLNYLYHDYLIISVY